ncbi:hypothetical protein [Clostridium ljungdahlii]|uniref:Uncharacterized protein n=1 Tax=Clostridium ljungdahlii TaxID=1538 RepID=A0A168MHJ1_9CLOT|nr:hypothetical protein [Clostridium ljungdahlii]OAA84700.1 hypothetical protein WY13_02599 [Clostridium ljungdahlii]
MSAKLIFKFKKNLLQIFQWSSANAVIDGKNTIKVPWTQETELLINEGHHRIQMSFPYMGSESGKASIEFNIRDEETFIITYKPPLTILTGGTILVETNN